MTFPGMRLIHKDQRGITLIEMLVAVALVGIISGGITMAISQVLTISTRASNHMVAVRQVQQAGKEVSKDTLQAQNVTPGETSGFPLTLTWTDWDGPDNVVVYSITEDNKLQRSHSVSNNGTTTETSVIARYIDPAETSFVPSDGAFIFKVTATVGGQSETREYEVEPRPG